jgi:hypothetical protein
MAINFGGGYGGGSNAFGGGGGQTYGGANGGTLYGSLVPQQVSGADVFGAQQARQNLGTVQAGETQRANIAANAQMLPAQLAQQRFNSVLPLLSGQIGGNADPYVIGGNLPPAPNISTSGVYNPQQIQQQVNTQKAANDQSTATQQRSMQQGLAGRGYGANSPLSQALGAGLQNQNLATNTGNETQTRLGAQQANVQQSFAGQQAQQQQYAQNQQLQIQRAQPYFQRQNTLIQALSGMA